MNDGKICVSVCAPSADELSKRIADAEELADMIEIRFDCLPPAEIGAALQLKSLKPVIATFRSIEQGGRRDIRLPERQAFWRDAGDQFWGVDLEEDIFHTVKGLSKRILSFHDHNGADQDIGTAAERMLRAGADIIKVAVTVLDAVDAIPVWKQLDKGIPVVPIGMGEAGKWTRILGLAHGAYLTYASTDARSRTAEGQITAEELIEVYRAKSLTLETRVYGVIGDPVSGSLSPYLHNAAFAKANIDSVFIPLQVKDLNAFITRMAATATREVELNFGGFAVTMPHKRGIIKYLHHLNPMAAAIGAVNTVKIDGDRMIGYNTDAEGFIEPLRRHLGELRDARVGVVGSGGAATACVHALRIEGADVTIFARDPDRARKVFSRENGLKFVPLLPMQRDRIKVGDLDVLVNATPVGMKGVLESETIFTADQLSGVRFVYDLVTRIDDTPLIEEAAKADIPAIGGLEMLVAQAELQFEIWTGSKPEPGLMMEAALSRNRCQPKP